MIKIRLARYGKKKQPTYRLVVADVRQDTRGDYRESVGFYMPTVQPKSVSLKADRIKYWLSVGAQCSPTVHNLLVSQGVIQGSKVKAARVKIKPSEKAAPVEPVAVPAAPPQTAEAAQDPVADSQQKAEPAAEPVNQEPPAVVGDKGASPKGI